MKKKLALLLAAVMTITCFPMTAMAASTNGITTRVNGTAKTLILEDGLISKGADTLDDDYVNTNLEAWVTGGELSIELKERMSVGDSFKVTLNNSHFMFRNTATTTGSFNTSGADSNVMSPTSWKAYRGDEEDFFGVAGTNTTGLLNKVFQSGTGNAAVTSGDNWSYTTDTSGTVTTNTFSFAAKDHYHRLNNVNASGSATVLDGITGTPTETYDKNNGIYFPNGVTGTSAAYNGVYVRFPVLNSGEDFYEDAPYVMIMGVDEKTATIYLGDDLVSGDIIKIPLVTRLTGDGDYTVRIDENSKISNTTHTFADKVEGKTKVTTTTVTARDTFSLDPIYIKEQRIGSIKNASAFRLKAPSGYTFDYSKMTLYTELDVKWISTSQSGLGVKDVDYAVDYRTTNSGTKRDESAIDITALAVTQSQSVRGSIVIKGLKLVSDDPDKVSQDKELSLTITDIGSSTNESFTEETFKVATVSDYLVALTRVDTSKAVPTLVSGRYEGDYVYYDGTNKAYEDDISDDDHLAAEVKFAEKIVDAWWAERTTKFTLPEDVTVLKAQIVANKVLYMPNAKAGFIQGTNGSLYNGNSSNEDNGVYYNLKKKAGNVTIKNNEITLNNLSTNTSGDTASFQMKLWLGIDATFEGDIDLKLTGTSIRDMDATDEISLTIAKAIRPVEITTKVSEVQVGYQYFTVADFDITETAAGNLLYGKDFYVSVSDGISVDMEIAPGFTAKVSAGDLKISSLNRRVALGVSNINSDTEGQITFSIDRESTEASTISFSNVQVKVSRNVPYSNLSSTENRGIDIYAWGPAIAQNYYYLNEFATSVNGSAADPYNTYDLFLTPGISTKYIHVATAADNRSDSEFINVVEVTIGNPVIKINSQDFTMPVAAYVSTASNSTMIPIRFVANALGLPEDAVKWDDANRIATVMTSDRIVQFQIGNSNYFVNNAPIPMLSPDGLAVTAEITNDRTFIPFRALGEAFNIRVSWDSATSTATYNAPEVK